ncbi:MAG: ribonuclease P protein component [Bacteroidales bacterium]|nr:ribonuclease P protein component [Bacteroidales bacterium]
MNNKRETFKKSERLCSRKILSGLSEYGNVFYSSFFKIIWTKIPVQDYYPVQVAFSVSKKGFRHAVTRNLIKRRIKEAYRKNKYLLYDFLNSEKIRIALLIVFKDSTIPGYQSVEKSMNELIAKLINNIRKTEKNC